MNKHIKITAIIVVSLIVLFHNKVFGQNKEDLMRVLLITGGHSFDEEPFYAFVKSLQGCTVTEVKHPDALSMFRPENRASYDVVLFYDMPAAISEQEKKDFTDCLNEGKGMVVWHHAYCSYQDWPEYQNIIGGRYHEEPWTDSIGVKHPASTYKHGVKFHVKVADSNHPITKGIKDFDITDEIYGGGSVNQEVHTLLTADAPTGGTSSVAWTNHYGNSNIVTILLGHDNEAWKNPDFKKLLTQAVMWAKKSGISGQSQWVGIAPDGKLIYKTTPKGDRIMDFSSAGYMGGGVAFPDVPVKKTVRPLGNGADDTKSIQAAIDDVAALPMKNGFHGAVLLDPGVYFCSKAIKISVSGIVLRGSGSEGKNASILMMNGEGKYPAININPDNTQDNASSNAKNPHTTIADYYVPSGTKTFNVASAEGFSAGDIIRISRPTTKEWVHFMGMDDLVRNGAPQTWLGLGRQSIHIRRIAAINGKTVTLDVPLSDSYDSQYFSNGSVEVLRIAGNEPVMPLSQVGIEHLRIKCPPLETDYGSAPYSGIRIGGQDCWVDDVLCIETMNTIPIAGRRVTIRDTRVTHTFPNLGASKPADFSIEGSQILIDRCSSDGGNTYWVWTNSYNTGPNVVLNSNFTGRGSRIQPHQRWATGFLVDNCRTPDGGIDLPNRGVAGSGHGWCMGWGVVWNCTAATFIVQNPPGALNWAIGCVGRREQTARYFDTAPILPEGIFESHGVHVAPVSLYLAQLAARLGSKSLEAIGYAPGSPAALALENPVMPVPKPQPATPEDFEFGKDLAFLRPVNTSSVHKSDTSDPRKFGGEKALDGNTETYWMPDESHRSVDLEIDTEGPLEINALTISEPAGIANVRAYKIEGQIDSGYTLLAEGKTIGQRKVHTFPKATVWKVRITILDSEATPAISELSLYCKR